MAKKTKGHIGGRDSKTGKFIPIEETYRRPNTTQREVIPNPGRGDTGRSGKKKTGRTNSTGPRMK